jgi:hypothetical protein
MSNYKCILIVPLLIILGILFCGLANAQDKYTLEYKFQEGENLQYKSERQDSTVSNFGGQEMTNQITMWSLETLSVPASPEKGTFSISIKSDSMWTDQDETTEGQPGGGRRIVMRGPGGAPGRQAQEYKINKFGKSITDDDVASPYLLPLPENPVSVNDTWDFEIQIETRGRRTGTTAISGKCLLYEVQQNLAVIIVNSESKGQGEFKFRREGMDEISGTTASSSTASSLVYFDIEKGRIVETVSEENREGMTESTMFSSQMNSKSKTTRLLLSE